MKKVIFITILIILVIIGFYLHSQDELPFINYQKEEIEISYESTSDESDYYMINAERVTGDVLGKEVVNNFIEEKISDFKAMAEEDLSNAENGFVTGKYSLDLKVKDYSTDQYISYLLKFGEYTGGANMNQTVKSFIFNRNTKEQLTLEEVVDEDAFMKKIKKELLAGEEEGNFFPGVSEEISLEDIDSFYITEEEVVILFSKYKVAPGVAGVVEISLDEKDLVE